MPRRSVSHRPAGARHPSAAQPKAKAAQPQGPAESKKSTGTTAASTVDTTPPPATLPIAADTAHNVSEDTVPQGYWGVEDDGAVNAGAAQTPADKAAELGPESDKLRRANALLREVEHGTKSLQEAEEGLRKIYGVTTPPAADVGDKSLQEAVLDKVLAANPDLANGPTPENNEALAQFMEMFKRFNAASAEVTKPTADVSAPASPAAPQRKGNSRRPQTTTESGPIFDATAQPVGTAMMSLDQRRTMENLSRAAPGGPKAKVEHSDDPVKRGQEILKGQLPSPAMDPEIENADWYKTFYVPEEDIPNSRNFACDDFVKFTWDLIEDHRDKIIDLKKPFDEACTALDKARAAAIEKGENPETSEDVQKALDAVDSISDLMERHERTQQAIMAAFDALLGFLRQYIFSMRFE